MASRKPKAPVVDPRDAAIEQSMECYHGGRRTKASPQVLEDLRYFKKCADAGRPISMRALVDFFRRERGVNIGKVTLARICEDHNIERWW